MPSLRRDSHNTYCSFELDANVVSSLQHAFQCFIGLGLVAAFV